MQRGSKRDWWGAAKNAPATLASIAAWLLLSSVAPVGATEKPQRIVSLNLCTDQILMMLVERHRISAVSYLSRNDDTSVMAQQARQLPVTRGLAEEILTLKADLVLAGTFTTRPTVSLLRRVGRNVVVVPPAYSLDEIRKNIRLIAAAVGERRKGEEIIADFNTRLKQLAGRSSERKPRAVTYYASNYTSGDATLVDDVIKAAGFRNLATEIGTRGTGRLSLEELVSLKPDLVVLGRTRAQYKTVTAENLRHPAFKTFLKSVPHVSIPDRLWICGTPNTLEAIERLSLARTKLLNEAQRNE